MGYEYGYKVWVWAWGMEFVVGDRVKIVLWSRSSLWLDLDLPGALSLNLSASLTPSPGVTPGVTPGEGVSKSMSVALSLTLTLTLALIALMHWRNFSARSSDVVPGAKV